MTIWLLQGLVEKLLIKLEMIMHVAKATKARGDDAPRGPRPKLVDTWFNNKPGLQSFRQVERIYFAYLSSTPLLCLRDRVISPSLHYLESTRYLCQIVHITFFSITE